jgi:hypothetical protein
MFQPLDEKTINKKWMDKVALISNVFIISKAVNSTAPQSEIKPILNSLFSIVAIQD